MSARSSYRRMMRERREELRNAAAEATELRLEDLNTKLLAARGERNDLEQRLADALLEQGRLERELVERDRIIRELREDLRKRPAEIGMAQWSRERDYTKGA